MAIFKNQRSVSRVASILMAAIVCSTSGFSVSAQKISDKNSINTETKISESNDLTDGDNMIGDPESMIDVVEGVTVKVKVGGQKYKKISVPKGTVAQALEYLDIELGEDDTVNQDLSADLKDGAKIKVNRISYETKTKSEKFAYKTVEKDNSKLYVGESEVVQKGKNGTKKVTYTSKIVNGKVKETFVTNSQVTKKAVKEIVKVGTKRKNYVMYQQNNTTYKTKSTGGAGTFVDHNGNTVAYTKKFTGKATAYTASPGARTSVGDAVHIGGVAVNPRIIPYGSKLYIETSDGNIVYGYAVANDTGGFIYTSDTLCDLFYNNRDVCYQFGRRYVNLYILA